MAGHWRPLSAEVRSGPENTMSVSTIFFILNLNYKHAECLKTPNPYRYKNQTLDFFFFFLKTQIFNPHFHSLLQLFDCPRLPRLMWGLAPDSNWFLCPIAAKSITSQPPVGVRGCYMTPCMHSSTAAIFRQVPLTLWQRASVSPAPATISRCTNTKGLPFRALQA